MLFRSIAGQALHEIADHFDGFVGEEETRDAAGRGGPVAAGVEAGFEQVVEGNGFVLAGEGAAAPYTFLFASVLVLLFGPERYSLDWWRFGVDSGSYE